MGPRESGGDCSATNEATNEAASDESRSNTETSEPIIKHDNPLGRLKLSLTYPGPPID